MEKYHMTESRFLESISMFGLIPKNGDNSKSIKDSKNVVFYSEGMEGAIVLFLDFKKHYEEFKGEKGRAILAQYRDVVSGKEKVDNGTYVALGKQAEQITKVQESDNFRSFLGEGVYLSLDSADEEIDDRNFNFANAWTTHKVESENLDVVVLRNKKDGTLLSSRYDVINYMMSMVPVERIKGLPINGDLKDYIEKYYERYAGEISKIGDAYSEEKIGIKEYIDLRSKGKFKQDLDRKYLRHKTIEREVEETIVEGEEK